jgi:hypothetical protein
MPHYLLIKRGWKTWGKLLSDYTYITPIVGYSVRYHTKDFYVHLTPDGKLFIAKGSFWDFGTGPVIQDLAMVYASLPHDMFSHLTNAGKLPWAERYQADKYFYHCLSIAGSTMSRFWRFPGVFLYSQLIARWKDKV